MCVSLSLTRLFYYAVSLKYCVSDRFQLLELGACSFDPKSLCVSSGRSSLPWTLEDDVQSVVVIVVVFRVGG